MKIVRALTLVILFFSGTCLLRAEGSRETVPDKSQPAFKFAIVYPLVHPFFESVTEQAILYGRKHNVELVFRAPEGKNVDQQIRMIDELIGLGVDGIALCATDPEALVSSVNKAMNSGIPVITFESDMPVSGRICFIGTDNYRAGRDMGALIAEVLDLKGSVIITTGLSTQMSLKQRIDGIRDVLTEEFPEVVIADIRSGEGNPALTYSIIEEQIVDHPDFDVFTSIDATGGPVAVTIWKARGWTGEDHKIVTFDDMSQNLDGIRYGIVSGIVSQKQWTWGPLIIDRLLAIRNGETVLEYFDTGTVVITKDNVNYYRQE